MSKTTMEMEGDRAITISRTFDAPAEVVFDAWTQPKYLKQWWAPRSHGVEMVEVTADVRPGGQYRYVMGRGAERIEFYGTYREVKSPTRLLYTQIFAPFPDSAAEVTVTFTESNGKTTLLSREVYPSAAVRKQVIDSGMESGMRETFDQLAALVTAR